MGDIFAGRRKIQEPVTTGSDVDRYETGQLWLLKDGSYLYVVDVDEPTRMNNGESTRSVYGKIGHTYTKKGMFSSENNVLIENPQMGQRFVIDCGKSVKVSIEYLRDREALFIGKVNPKKSKELQKMIQDA